MKLNFVFAIALTVAVSCAQAAPPTPSDRWIVEDIASHTGMRACEVRSILGDGFPVAAEQYAMHPSARGRIQRAIAQHRGKLRAEQSGEGDSSTTGGCVERKTVEPSPSPEADSAR